MNFIKGFFIRLILSAISLIFIGIFFIVDSYIYPDSCASMIFTPILLLAYSTLFFSIVSIIVQLTIVHLKNFFNTFIKNIKLKVAVTILGMAIVNLLFSLDSYLDTYWISFLLQIIYWLIILLIVIAIISTIIQVIFMIIRHYLEKD